MKNETTLYDVYDEYPDEDELIWNYVGEIDFENLRFPINRIKIHKIVDNNFLNSFKKNSDSWQKKYVKHIVNNINKFKDIPVIVDFDNKIIVDGNHRLIGMYLSGLKYVNVIDINY